MKTTKLFKLLIFSLICIGAVLIWERYSEEKAFMINLERENQWVTTYKKDYKEYSNIRVLITDSDDESYQHDSVKIQSQVPMIVRGAMNVTIPANVVLDIGDMLSQGETVHVQSSQAGVGIKVLSLTKGDENPVYEGTLEISNHMGSYQIINEVGLETYLKYVVPSEMPSSYPLEALKAQAVCARTYALRQMADQRLSKYGVDVDDTIRFQVYAHIEPQQSTTKAVKDTMGQIISYENEPIEAYFFSTSCGFTSGMEVWNEDKDVPYLRAVSLASVKSADTEVFSQKTGILSEESFVNYLNQSNTGDLESSEDWYRWNVTFSWENLKNRVYSQYPKIGQLQNIKILKRSTGGAVISLALQGKLGTVTIDNEYDIREFFSPKDQKVILQDGSKAPKQKLLPSAYFYIKTKYKDGAVSGLQLIGGGYGHGVGLSQNGAKYMAMEGLTWRAIIKRFYQDVKIIDIR